MRLRLVAEITRTSILTGFRAPTGSTSPSRVARRGFSLAAGGRSAPPAGEGGGAAGAGPPRLAPPIARAMDGARDQLLADAGLALDQHGDGRGRRLLGGAQHGLHARALGDDVLEGERARAAALEARELAFERARGERVAQADLQPLRPDRLDHEVHGAPARGRPPALHAAVGGRPR